jgi:hypothetical protein
MNLLKQKTSKLYYGKWPYKIACYLPKSCMIVRIGPSKFRPWIERLGMSHWSLNQNITNEMKENLVRFMDHVEPFLDKDIQIRAEGAHFNIFCRDTLLRDRIVKALNEWITDVYGPESDEELAFMLSNSNKKVVCNKLPYEQYRYKVYFKEAMPAASRSQFLSWILKYPDTTRVSDSSQRWLNYRKYWMQSPFMYVEDDKTLAMIGLFLGHNIKKVEEFILRSGISSV